MTNNLKVRIEQHKEKMISGFTKKYNTNKLVHFEVFDDVISAIAREKVIKGWIRKKKIALINENNPDWDDLSKNLQV